MTTLRTIIRSAAALTCGVALGLLTPAHIAGHLTMTPMTACTEEDASGADQTFPCVWDAHTQGNLRGTSVLYVVRP